MINYVSRENIAIYAIECFCKCTGKPATAVGNAIKHGGWFYKRLKNGGSISPLTEQKVVDFIAIALEKTPDQLRQEAILSFEKHQAKQAARYPAAAPATEEKSV
jgi:hypothetical protein